MNKPVLLNRRCMLSWTCGLFAAAQAPRAAGATLQVGPRRELKSLAAAARRATAGMTIAVDAGDYRGDVAVWTQDDLQFQAVGGRVRLIADGAAAEGKGIWVIRARGIGVEGFDFEGASVPSSNGAGIRLDTGTLRVRDCSFVRNQMGLLTNNDPGIELDVEDSEFAHNQRPDGHNHNLYVGQIKRLSVTGSYLHHGARGHLLKSRAARSFIAYNRLTDEADGKASYELEFPNGGIAHVIGNIVQQSASTDNPQMISFGAEGYRWPANELYLSHNTLVDDLPAAGEWLRVWPGAGTVRIVDNLLAGSAHWNAGAGAELHNNLTIARASLPTAGADAYHAGRDMAARLRAIDAGTAHGVSLTPDRQYVHPRHTLPLRTTDRRVGALQPITTTPR